MLVPCGQLVVSGIFQLDIAKIIGDVVLVQPCSRLLAGGAFGVADKDRGPTLLLLQKYISCPFRTGIRFFQTKLLPNTCVVQSSIRIFSAT